VLIYTKKKKAPLEAMEVEREQLEPMAENAGAHTAVYHYYICVSLSFYIRVLILLCI
jgi:hypothetical protein